jgi:hypothetical protein
LPSQLLIVFLLAGPEEVRLEAPREAARFDAAEFRLSVAEPSAKNPFREVEIAGEFKPEGPEARSFQVEGFCDSRDGSLHLLRFCPPAAGAYLYSIRYRSPGALRTFTGRLEVREDGRPGPVVADPAHPRKLIREGDRKPFFHLGYTAYHLLDPSHTEEDLERTIAFCAEERFTKVRFLLTGYPRDPPQARPRERKPGDGEFGVVDPATLPNYGARPGRVNPLPAWEGKPHGYDFLRMNPDHWRRADRAVRLLRERGMLATAVVTIEKQGLPQEYGARSEAELFLYRYAVARLAAFDNVWWDLGNEHNEYRDSRWGEAMGGFVREHDPYRRMASAHAYAEFLYPRSAWATYIIVQQYGDPAGVRDWVLKHRALSKPFVNEEYGYEGRNPSRAIPGHGAERNETRRRHWAIAFGGGYATYGDWVDGAWYYEGLPGPGPAARELKHLREFCESIPFNAMEPRDEVVEGPALAFTLLGSGRLALYFPYGGTASVRLGTERPGRGDWFDPRTGARRAAAPVEGKEGSLSFQSPGDEDWALDLVTAPRAP